MLQEPGVGDGLGQDMLLGSRKINRRVLFWPTDRHDVFTPIP